MRGFDVFVSRQEILLSLSNGTVIESVQQFPADTPIATVIGARCASAKPPRYPVFASGQFVGSLVELDATVDLTRLRRI